MNSFVTIVALNGLLVESHEVAGMMTPLLQRGYRKVWTNDGPAGLGYNVRSVQESTIEKQPLVDHDERYVLVADLRLDNRDALRQVLGIGETSDTGLLLAAYARWGTDCTDHLIGPFAFALWDIRQRTLFCARDYLGLRPLYYTQTATHIAVASSAGALLTLPWVARRIQDVEVVDYLMGMHLDESSTFYEGVYRLPPAHHLVATPEDVTVARYWQPDLNHDIRYTSDAEYEEAFETHFAEAIRCRLGETQATGTLLSGGLDSSSITGVTRTLLGATEDKPLDTFSLVFDEVPASNERPFIEAMLARGGFRPHFIHGDRYHALEEVGQLLDQLDAPVFSPNLFLMGKLFEAAQAAGLDVMLDGYLGDNVVGYGTTYLTELATRGRWVQLNREIALVAKHQGWSLRKARRKLLRRFVRSPLFRQPAQRLGMKFGLTKPTLPDLSLFLNPALLQHVSWRKRARAYGVLVPQTPRTVREADIEALYASWVPLVTEELYRVAKMHDVEVRLPFSDQRLATFCLALPPTQKYNAGWTRRILRRSLRRYLPEEIHSRHSKGNASYTFHHGLRVLGRDALASLLIDRLHVARPFLDIPVVQEAYRRYIRGEQDEVAAFLWRVAVLVQWLEREQNIANQANALPQSIS